MNKITIYNLFYQDGVPLIHVKPFNTNFVRGYGWIDHLFRRKTHFNAKLPSN